MATQSDCLTAPWTVDTGDGPLIGSGKDGGVGGGGGVKVTRRGANTSEVSAKHRITAGKDGKATSHFGPGRSGG